MKKIKIFLMVMLLIMGGLVYAIPLFPQGPIELRNVYGIQNVTNISMIGSGDLYINNVGQKKFWYNQTIMTNIFNQNLNTTNNVQFENGTFYKLAINKVQTANIGIDIRTGQNLTQGLRIETNGSKNISFSTFVLGDAQVRFRFSGDGEMGWGDGVTSVDTQLFRGSGRTLNITNNLNVKNNMSIGNFLGIGTATPTRTLDVRGSANITLNASVDNSFSTRGYNSFGVTPTVSSCGGISPDPSISGNNNAGQVITGGLLVSTCSVSFALPTHFIGKPSCIANNQNTSVLMNIINLNATGFTINFDTSVGTGTQVNWICMGY